MEVTLLYIFFYHLNKLSKLFLADSRISSIVAGPLSHTVPSVGYVIEEKAIPGSIDAKKVTVSHEEDKLKN